MPIVVKYAFLYKLRKEDYIIYYNDLWRNVHPSYFRKYKRIVVHEDEMKQQKIKLNCVVKSQKNSNYLAPADMWCECEANKPSKIRSPLLLLLWRDLSANRCWFQMRNIGEKEWKAVGIFLTIRKMLDKSKTVKTKQTEIVVLKCETRYANFSRGWS